MVYLTKVKVFLEVLFLAVIIAFSGCSNDEPAETGELEENQGKTIQGQPTPTQLSTPVPNVKGPEETGLPEDFKERKFELRGTTVFLSFPSDWKLSGSSIYKKNFNGWVNVVRRLHIADCADDFAGCISEKYPAQNWSEFGLENCEMQAATRLSYKTEKEIQLELWVDFPGENKGVLAVCTQFIEETGKELCLAILSSFRC